MALVRKLQPGGPVTVNLLSGLPKIDSNDWNTELNNQISSYNLTGKSERSVREALGKLQNYFTSDLDKKSFEVNDIDNTYKISGSGGDQFAGTNDDIGTNFFTGKMKADNSQDAMSIAASIYGNTLKKFKSSPSAQTGQTGQTGTLAGEQGKNTVKINDFSDILLNQFGGKDANVKTGFNDMYKTDAARQEAIYNTTLKGIADYRKKHAENQAEYEYSDIDKLSAVEEAAKRAQLSKTPEDWNKYLTEAYKLGWSPQKFLIQQNERDAWDKEAGVQKAEQTKQTLVQSGLSPENAAKYSGFTLDPNFGNIERWKDNPWMVDELKGTIALLNPISQKHIVLKNGQLFNGKNEHGRWENTDEGFTTHFAKPPVPIKPITNFTKGWEAVLKDTENPLSNILSKSYYDLNNAESKYNQTISNLGVEGFTNDHIEELHKVAASLKQVMRTGSHEERNKAFETYKKLTDLFKQNPEILKIWDDYKHGGFAYKEGGILKFQKGGIEEFMRTHKIDQNKALVSAQNPTKFKDMRGTWGGEDTIDKALDVASIAGTAQSFVPVYGAIGAGVTTVADLWKDYRHLGKDRTLGELGTNLALNVGFTALSLFGAGALGATFKAAKIAKVGKIADIAFDGEKILSKAIKLGVDAKPIEKLVAAGINTTKDADVAIDAIKAGKEIGITLEEINAGLKHIGTVGKLPSSLGEVAIKATGKGIEKVLNNKFISTATKTAIVGQGAKSGYDIITTANEDGLGATKVDDWKGLGLGLSMGNQWAKKAIGAKYGLEATEKIPASLTSEIKGKPINLVDDDLIKQYKKPNFNPFSKKNKVLKEEFVKSYNAKLKEGEEAIKFEDLEKIGLREAKNSGYQIRETIDPENYWTQKYGKKYATQYRLAPKASGKEIVSKVEEVKPDTKSVQVDIKNLEKIKGSGKSRSVDQQKNVEKYLAERKGRVKPVKPVEPVEPVETPTPKIEKTPEEVIKSVNKKTKKPKPKPKVKLEIKEPEVLDKVIKRKYISKKQKSLNNASLKAGGILKLENGTTDELILGSLDPTLLTEKAKDTQYLNWNKKSGTAGIFDDKGEYTQDFLERRKLITPEWFNANKAEIQKRINQSGSTFKLDTIDQLLRGTADYKPGILHDIVMSSTLNREKLKPLPIPGAALPIDASKIKFPKLSDIPAPKMTSGGNEIDIKKKFNLEGLKKYLPDATDLSNLAMYANTVGSNRRIGDEQRKAISDSMYTLPYMQHTYMRADKPYSLQADKQAASFESKAARMAGSTADIDKGFGVRLSAQQQVSAMKDKANMADQQRVDQMRGQQLQSNVGINKFNTDVLGKNRALTSGAFSKIHLINANQHLAQNAALNNLVLAANKNIPVKEYKRNLAEMYKYATDPKMKEAYDEYNLINDDANITKGKAFYDAEYNKYKTTAGGTVLPWEQSQQYTNWNNAKKAAELRMITANKPYLQAQQRIQYGLPLLYSNQQQAEPQTSIWSFAKGGGLSKQDKMDIDQNKAEYTRKQKDTEMTFKAIFHNNEMLQKALIKVFK